MKTFNQIILPALLFLSVETLVCAQGGDAGSTSLPQGIAPTVDAQGRFWVYRNGPLQPRMPFVPYGWMSDATNNLSQILHVDIENRERPNSVFRPPQSEKECSIQIKIVWGNASWAGLAFISGPDKPAWWGDSNRGRYFNLSGLPKKKLVLYARGERGGESIKVQIGVLAGRPFGDSLSKPLMTEELKLTQEWTKQEIDLKGLQPSELTRICNGFGVVADQASQPGPGTETTFYIDDVYFE
jgi:hypothetical protein